jgi:hypothetical protein
VTEGLQTLKADHTMLYASVAAVTFGYRLHSVPYVRDATRAFRMCLAFRATDRQRTEKVRYLELTPTPVSTSI